MEGGTGTVRRTGGLRASVPAAGDAAALRYAVGSVEGSIPSRHNRAQQRAKHTATRQAALPHALT